MTQFDEVTSKTDQNIKLKVMKPTVISVVTSEESEIMKPHHSWQWTVEQVQALRPKVAQLSSPKRTDT